LSLISQQSQYKPSQLGSDSDDVFSSDFAKINEQQHQQINRNNTKTKSPGLDSELERVMNEMYRIRQAALQQQNVLYGIKKKIVTSKSITNNQIPQLENKDKSKDKDQVFQKQFPAVRERVLIWVLIQIHQYQ